MIDDYLNQAATWKAVTGRSASTQPIFTDTAIAVRWEATRRLVRDAAGEQVVSEALVVTQAAVKAGDRLIDPAGRTWPVIAVSIRVDLDGDELFREVRV